MSAPVREVPSSGGGAGQTTVGLTAVQISSSSVQTRLVQVKAMSTNTNKIYIGWSNAVTTSTGHELSAGEFTAWIPVSDLSKLWFISDAATQKISYLYLNHT